MLKILKGEHNFQILKQEARVIGVTMKDTNRSSFTFTTTPSPCFCCSSGYHCKDSSNEAECYWMTHLISSPSQFA